MQVRAYLPLSCLSLGLLLAGNVPPRPPLTKQKPVTDVVQGLSITDSYRWLEDQQSPETRAWIAAQQAYTKAYFDSLSGRDQVRKRLSELMRVDSYGLPTVRKDRLFFLRHPADKNQNQLCLREGSDGKDQILVDANLLSNAHPVTVRLLDVSKDASLVIYGLQEGGQDEITLHFFDVNRRQPLAETLPKARYEQASWLPDHSGFYHSELTSKGPRVYFHKMGADPSTDTLIFGDKYGPETDGGGTVTYDGRWLILTATTGWGSKSDVYVMRLGRDEKPRAVITNLDGDFSPDYYDGHLYVTTTWKSPNRRIFSVDLAHPEQASWKDVVPEQSDHIESFSVVGGRLLVTYLHNVVSQVKIYSLTGVKEHELSFPTLGSVVDVRGEPDQNGVYYTFNSFVYPPTNFQYDLATGSQSIWWRPATVAHTEDFVVKQVWYTSRDQTRVPMFLVYKKGLKTDGTARGFMTAYGGFDISLTPAYDQMALYWVEQGGVFALPNLRGGGEFGESWHRAGMFEKKQNVFDDFEAAAEYLEKSGYTTANRLGIEGTSNGGLLVGAALTQRPDLFGAVICRYPLLDMLRYDRFKTGKLWIAEYGSADNKNQFSYILKYSPYQHVEKGAKYPATLFVTGDGDTRVDPLHARKMAALMQSANASGNPILLKYDTTSGHSGGKPLEERINDTTELVLFLDHQLR